MISVRRWETSVDLLSWKKVFGSGEVLQTLEITGLGMGEDDGGETFGADLSQGMPMGSSWILGSCLGLCSMRIMSSINLPHGALYKTVVFVSCMFSIWLA